MTDIHATLLSARETELEADLQAMARDFGTAARLMRDANRKRAEIFGDGNPNTLRDLADQWLDANPRMGGER